MDAGAPPGLAVRPEVVSPTPTAVATVSYLWILPLPRTRHYAAVASLKPPGPQPTMVSAAEHLWPRLHNNYPPAAAHPQPQSRPHERFRNRLQPHMISAANNSWTHLQGSHLPAAAYWRPEPGPRRGLGPRPSDSLRRLRSRRIYLMIFFRHRLPHHLRATFRSPPSNRMTIPKDRLQLKRVQRYDG